ncbi:MAG: bifunctional ADP-heptose synthase [Candidatus Aminicenantes bacterium]|nr:bifunctional ADP-heptose synthase [Candidatus Aminicenantes bacterium]
MSQQDLKNLIDRFQGLKIAVWGDFILDQYLYGLTRRISREAPVLIISYEKEEYAPGGAGNSVLNLSALGAEPLPIGVIGDDEAGEKIVSFFKQRNIPVSSLIRLKNFKTPIKTRILAGEENTRHQQVLRIDREAIVPDKENLLRRLYEHLQKAVTKCQAILISDYNYMTVKTRLFTSLIQACRQHRLPVTLDSRFRLLSFRGVTIATPNEPEAEAALHMEINKDSKLLIQAGQLLLRRLASQAVLITRGSKGMVLFERNQKPFFIPIYGSTDIVDVTGAGDTVISVITLALASGSNFRQAALLANYAGGLVVMKKGTATVSPQELKNAISS